jgi:hypothetical protein
MGANVSPVALHASNSYTYLDSHLQASITDEQDYPPTMAALSACNERPEQSSDGESDAAVKYLRKILALRR